MLDNQAKTQINNLWNYLDELSENNPEEYKKFISAQMKKGLNENKKDTIEKEKFLKVNTYLVMRYKILNFVDININKSKDNLKLFDVAKNDLLEVPKIIFSSEFQAQAFNSKIKETPKMYLNIVHSREYFPPTDEKGNYLSDLEDDLKWKFIPSQIRHNGHKTSLSGTRCEFYEILVHSVVVNKMKCDPNLKQSILSYFTQKFSSHLSDSIKLYTDNVKILEEKSYKSKQNYPDDFLLKPENKSQEQNRKPIAKNFMDENKINIPKVSENFTNTETFYNLPKNTKSSSTKKQEKQKILIQEIKHAVKINFTKHVLSNNTMEVIFDLSVFDIDIGIDKIDLNISENKIKLNFKDCELKMGYDFNPVGLVLDFCVNPELCSGYYQKIDKKLKIILVRK